MSKHTEIVRLVTCLISKMCFNGLLASQKARQNRSCLSHSYNEMLLRAYSLIEHYQFLVKKTRNSRVSDCEAYFS